jgi:hypothetical protein
MKDSVHRKPQLLISLKRLSLGQLGTADVSGELEILLICDFQRRDL